MATTATEGTGTDHAAAALEQAAAGHGGGSELHIDPMHQFEITSLFPISAGGVDLSFTNSSLWMLIIVLCSTALMYFGVAGRALVPGRLQNVAELLYGTIAGMVKDNVGKEGRQYFPFIFSLFIFILFANLIGLIPIAFTVTSHIIVTFAFAAFIFVAVTIIGFWHHGLGFLHYFFPHGAPAWTAVILIPIELVSYMSRPISLSVRLFANMVVGHVLLKVIGGFVFVLGVFGIVPILALVGITALEFLVAILQAYVFTILTCIYLHDAIHMH